MLSRKLGIELELVMPENAPVERVQMMKGFGAKVILTPAERGVEVSRDYAFEQVAKGGYLMLNQFANDDNWRAHYLTTGP